MTRPDNAASTVAPANHQAVQGEGFAHALPAGTELHDGKFRIERTLGQGGFGITYLASHTLLNIQVALKEYFPQQFATRVGTVVVGSKTADNLFEWGLGRFLEEAARQAQLRHPHIAAVTDFFRANDTAYMVLEYVAGQSFEDWLTGLGSKQPTPVEAAEIGKVGFIAWRNASGGRGPTQDQLDRIVEPLLDAVAFVHAQGLVHRDIKPDNIMIRATADGESGAAVPVLLDFGAARAAFDGEIARRKMTAIVSDGYSPLEQYQSDASGQGRWSDIFSLGATLYRAVTGLRPVSALDRIAEGAGEMPVEPRALRSDYRQTFLAAIDAATQMDARRRPATVERFRQGLFAKSFTQLPSAGQINVALPRRGLWQRVLRNPQRAATLTVPLVALLGGVIVYKLRAASDAVPVLAPGKTSLDATPAKKSFVDQASSPIGQRPIEVSLHVPKATYRVGDPFAFAVEANQDCRFLVYTISADDKVELHDPAANAAFMGDPLLKAGERRQIPIPGAPGIARINPPAGTYEIGAVCGREELARLGLGGAQLNEKTSGGRRSFSFALDSAIAKIDRLEIGRTAVTYFVIQ